MVLASVPPSFLPRKLQHQKSNQKPFLANLAKLITLGMSKPWHTLSKLTPEPKIHKKHLHNATLKAN